MYFGVAWGYPLVRTVVFAVRVSAVRTDAVDATRNDEREELLACPQRLWFEDGGLRNATVPRGQIHEKLHELSLKKQDKT